MLHVHGGPTSIDLDRWAPDIQAYVDAGCREFVLWFRDYPSTRSVERFAAEVMPQGRPASASVAKFSNARATAPATSGHGPDNQRSAPGLSTSGACSR